MIIFVVEHKANIKDIVINSSKTETRFLGSKYIIVRGTCKVMPDDNIEIDEPFTMDFTYEGKPGEPSSKLQDYLSVRGWNKYIEMNRGESDTLMDFIKKH